jgi:hypothetical protein
MNQNTQRKKKKFIPVFRFKPQYVEVISDNGKYLEVLQIMKVQYDSDLIRVTVRGRQ